MRLFPHVDFELSTTSPKNEIAEVYGLRQIGDFLRISQMTVRHKIAIFLLLAGLSIPIFSGIRETFAVVGQDKKNDATANMNIDADIAGDRNATAERLNKLLISLIGVRK